MGLGTCRFALTRSSSSSRVALSLGKRPLWNVVSWHATWDEEKHIQPEATSSSRRLSSARGLIHQQVSFTLKNSGDSDLLPVGSGSAGNMSLPQMAQTAAAEIIPANPGNNLVEYFGRFIFAFKFHTEKQILGIRQSILTRYYGCYLGTLEFIARSNGVGILNVLRKIVERLQDCFELLCYLVVKKFLLTALVDGSPIKLLQMYMTPPHFRHNISSTTLL